ncbi:MAG: hypothetical protein NC224_12335 [Bacteroides sp.]|nr:hypothetical protein [Bacteroides sp.]
MSYVMIESLLLAKRTDILLKEKTNRTQIYLYPVGEYWMAFNRSAYRLCCLYDCAGTSVIWLDDISVPVVTASVTDMELRNIMLAGSMRLCDGVGCKVLTVPVIADGDYRKWFMEETEDFG